MKSRIVSVAAILAVFAAAQGAWAQSAKTRLKDPVLIQRFNDISDRLVCQCGCQEMLSVCNHQNCPSAVPMRQQIEKRLKEGATDDQIVQEFVDDIGMKVLSSPPAEGFNLAAWIMPGFALILGLMIVFYMANRFAARKRLAAGPAPVDDNHDDTVRSRIEDELKRMDQ